MARQLVDLTDSFSINNVRIEVVFGKIGELNGDTVVNTTNSLSFQNVDGSISGELRDVQLR